MPRWWFGPSLVVRCKTIIVDLYTAAAPVPGAPASARLLRLPLVAGDSGSLVWGECGQHLPFAPLRFFCIRDVPRPHTRGNHAHRSLQEILVCVRGSCSVRVDDGLQTRDFVLDAPDVALYLPSLVWAIQHDFSPDAALVVLASEVYRADDYIRDYDEFRRLVARAP